MYSITGIKQAPVANKGDVVESASLLWLMQVGISTIYQHAI